MDRPQAFLYVWHDRFLWGSNGFKGGTTRRYATNVILAAGSRPFMLKVPHGPAVPCMAAICARGARRSVDATDVPFVSLNLDPETADARRLASLVADKAIVLLEPDLFTACKDQMTSLVQGRLDGPQAQELCDGIVSALALGQAFTSPVDVRVQSVAEQLRRQLPSDLALAPLARRHRLSPTRLGHLFSEQLGLPMSSYLLWAKMRQAVGLIQSRRSLTDIAHASGFADASHLTRTFQAFYAVRPSALADSRYVLVRTF